MHSDGVKLLKLMFREGETICVSPNQFGFHAIPLETVLSGKVEMLMNKNEDKGLLKYASEDLLLAALNPIKGPRLDGNCYQYRNFMIELDTGSLGEQINYIQFSGIPYSALIFSGGKSIHVLVALEDSLDSEKYYRYIAKWILNILPLADQNIQNPSRGIRIPGAIRDNGKKQRAYYLGKQVKPGTLMKWLYLHESSRPVFKEKAIYGGKPDFVKLSKWAQRMLGDGIKFDKGRNKGWFSLAVDFAMAGFSEEDAIAILTEKFEAEHDFKEKEFLSAISQGFKFFESSKI